MKKIGFLLMLLVASGCSDHQMAHFMNGMSGELSPEELESNRQQECVSLGAPPGSPNYYDCRKFIEQRLQAAQMQQQPQPIIMPQLAPIAYQRPLQTNCTGYGNQVSCTSQPTGIDPTVFDRIQPYNRWCHYILLNQPKELLWNTSSSPPPL